MAHEIHSNLICFKHPRFSGGLAYHFDVALLRLTTPANMDNPFIETAILADEGEDYTDSASYILGWGAEYRKLLFDTMLSLVGMSSKWNLYLSK